MSRCFLRAIDNDGDDAADSCEQVVFECVGAGKIIGVGNGNPLSHEDDVCVVGNWKRFLYNGKAQIVVRAAENPGNLTVRGATCLDWCDG